MVLRAVRYERVSVSVTDDALVPASCRLAWLLRFRAPQSVWSTESVDWVYAVSFPVVEVVAYF